MTEPKTPKTLVEYLRKELSDKEMSERTYKRLFLQAQASKQVAEEFLKKAEMLEAMEGLASLRLDTSVEALDTAPHEDIDSPDIDLTNAVDDEDDEEFVGGETPPPPLTIVTRSKSKQEDDI